MFLLILCYLKMRTETSASQTNDLPHIIFKANESDTNVMMLYDRIIMSDELAL